MGKLYRGRYRNKSTRLQSWDYAWNARYFVTICTGDRKRYFGKIINGQMKLSPIGQLVKGFWEMIPLHFPWIELDEYVIMPDHIHGIIKIYHDKTTRARTPESGVQPLNKKGGKNPKWKPGTLGVVINQFKRICTINARKIDPGFQWQSRYHDHIIRTERALNNIRRYIKNNPKKWHDDRSNHDITGNKSC